MAVMLGEGLRHDIQPAATGAPPGIVVPFIDVQRAVMLAVFFCLSGAQTLNGAPAVLPEGDFKSINIIKITV